MSDNSMSYDDAMQIFGFTSHPTYQELRHKHRKLIRENHPDRHSNEGEKVRKKFEAKTKKINQAKDIIEKFDSNEYSHQSHERRSSQDSTKKGGNRGSSGEKSRKGNQNYREEDSTDRNNGEDSSITIEISFRTGLQGGQHEFEFRQNGIVKTLTIRIKPRTQSGSKIRVKGYGGIGKNGGKNGDLYVTVKILPPSKGSDRYGYAVFNSASSFKKSLGLSTKVPVFDAHSDQFISYIRGKDCSWKQNSSVCLPGLGYEGDVKMGNGDLYVNTRFSGSAHLVRPLLAVSIMMLTFLVFVYPKNSGDTSDFQVNDSNSSVVETDQSNSDYLNSNEGVSNNYNDPADQDILRDSPDALGGIGDLTSTENSSTPESADAEATGSIG